MRVLIVDDSVVHGQRLTAILAELGHQVVGHARTGAAGVMLYKEHHPDLVCLDMVMPEMDGMTALRTLRSMDPEACVMLLSAVAGVGGRVEEALRLGAKDVLAKPFSREDVRKSIAKIAKKTEKK